MNESFKLPQSPKLRPNISVLRQRYTKSGCYILTDMQTGRSLRLSSIAYNIASQFDGHCSLDSIRLDKEIPDAERETIIAEVCQTLALAGLIEDVEAQTTNDKKLPGGKDLERILMSSRHPFGDARPLLSKINRLSQFAFSKSGLMVWLLIALLAGGALVNDSDSIVLPMAWLAQMTWLEGALLTLAILLGKFLHELGHAIALQQMCRKEGIDAGAIQIGITRFYFFPLPFTDATAAWRLGSRRRRAIVALAGVYLETLAASLAIIIWSMIDSEVMRGILLQFATISAISTLFFNLNPLVKLDGYYLLTDLLNFPNLQPRAQKAVANGINRFSLRSKKTTPASWSLIAYGIASFIYRLIISIGVATIAAAKSTFIAAIVLALAFSSIVARPFITFIRGLDLKDLMPRAYIFATALIILLLAPISEIATAPGIIESHTISNAVAPRTAILAHVDETNITFESETLDLEAKVLSAREKIARIELFRAKKTADPDALRLQERLSLISQSLEKILNERIALNFSPREEFSVSTLNARHLVGQAISTNEKLGVAYDQDQLRVRAILDQPLSKRVKKQDHINLVRIWLKGATAPLHATPLNNDIEPILLLPSPALARSNNGPIVLAPEENGALIPARTHFGIMLSLSEHNSPSNVRPGELVTVQYTFEKRPLVFIIAKFISQKLQHFLGNSS